MQNEALVFCGEENNFSVTFCDDSWCSFFPREKMFSLFPYKLVDSICMRRRTYRYFFELFGCLKENLPVPNELNKRFKVEAKIIGASQAKGNLFTTWTFERERDMMEKLPTLHKWEV